MRHYHLTENIESAKDIKLCAQYIVGVFVDVITDKVQDEFPFSAMYENRDAELEKFFEELPYLISEDTVHLHNASISGISDVFSNFLKHFPIMISFFNVENDPNMKGRWLSNENGVGGTLIINFHKNLPELENLLVKLFDRPTMVEKIVQHFVGKYYTVFQHELQHAYDAYRSSGKYKDPKLSGIDLKNPDNKDKYLKLKHEISAHYTQTMSDVIDSLDTSSTKKDAFYMAMEEFKNSMPGFSTFGRKTQQRLLKRASMEIKHHLND